MAGNPDLYDAVFLKESGKMLLQQTEEEEVLEILHGVATYLSTLEQLTANEVVSTFSPLPQALLTEKLLEMRKTSGDIGVVLATCLCEIMRLTAPKPIYDENSLKVVFEVIVNSLEDIYKISNTWFQMRIQNLETIANLRLVLVMLDIKCGELIEELFDIFLLTMREDYPANVFYLMETMMIDTINYSKEEEEISAYMIHNLLGSLQKNDREVSNISTKLAESVLKNCATKLKPHINEYIQSSSGSLDNYVGVVAAVCEGVSLSPTDTNDTNA